jgi:TonB-linked SusC/RagA family outer membrane protein
MESARISDREADIIPNDRSVIIAVLLLISAGPLLAQESAQEAVTSSTDEVVLGSPLLQSAQLVVENVPLSDALSRLRRGSGVRMAYSPSLMPDRRVSCSCWDATVEEALDTILAGTSFDYFVVAGQVVVEPAGTEGGRRATRARAVLDTGNLDLASAGEVPIVQQGTITGQVRESSTLQPLVGAQVSIPGTEIGAFTDEQGRYRFEDVPAGSVTIRAQMIGYSPRERTVTVGDGETVTVDFDLVERAIVLDELVITATGPQRRRQLGTSIAQLNVDAVTRTAPVRSLSELLTGRVSGVTASSTTGTTAEASRIRVRGSSSTSLSNEPLIYIDGVRVNSDPSRRGDLNPEDIASVEVMKGPSASTLYGTEAANGVILISTKSGVEDEQPDRRWRVWTETNLVTEPNQYPAIFGAVDASGNACPLTAVAAGQCTQAELRSFNLLENADTSPFENGLGGQLGTSLAGSTSGLDYYVSGEFEKNEGVYANDEVERLSFRANLGMRPTEDLQVRVNTGYLTHDQPLFIEGGTPLGPVTHGLPGTPDADGWFQYSPEKLSRIDTKQAVERLVGSTSVQANATSWLDLRFVAGLDVSTRSFGRLWPVGEFPGSQEQGERTTEDVQTRAYTAELLATVETAPVQDVTSTTSVGIQYFSDITEGVFGEGRILAPGTNSLGGAADTQVSEESTESRALGLFVDQRFGYQDRLFVTAGLRADDNSTFGQNFDAVLYPKVSASWVVHEGSSDADDGLAAHVDLFRLRGAWGQSGNQPGFTDALRFFNAVSGTTPGGQSQIGVSFDGGGLGNPNLKPERSTEVEFGFDATLFDDRLDASLTYYAKTTRDALIFRDVAPSVGATEGRWENLAKTKNSGVEAHLDALVLDAEDVQLTLPFSFSYNDNTLIELGEGISPLTAGNFQRHVEGLPLGGYWGQEIESFDDANGDGIIAPEEIVVSDTAVYQGPVFPPYSATLQPALRLFDRLELSGLFEYRGGFRHYNFTEAFRCLLGASRFRNDPDSPLENQADCVAYAVLGANGPFAQDGEFLKLREVSATWNAPSSWAQKMGADALTLTIAGRNMATWTSYPGIDPELARAGASNFETNDFFQPGPTRRWTLRANITF